MRYLLLSFLVLSGLACDNGEPIAATSSPLGCWRSSDGELDLMAGGRWQQTFNVSPTIDAGTWTYDAASGDLMLSIASASSANGPGTAFARVTELTPTEMWTAGNSGWTHWQAVACQAAEVPICDNVDSIEACSGHGSDKRLCAVCSSGTTPVVGCHALRDAAQGTGVTAPAAIADYHCVVACGACSN